MPASRRLHRNQTSIISSNCFSPVTTKPLDRLYFIFFFIFVFFLFFRVTIFRYWSRAFAESANGFIVAPARPISVRLTELLSAIRFKSTLTTTDVTGDPMQSEQRRRSRVSSSACTCMQYVYRIAEYADYVHLQCSFLFFSSPSLFLSFGPYFQRASLHDFAMNIWLLCESCKLKIAVVSIGLRLLSRVLIANLSRAASEWINH